MWSAARGRTGRIAPNYAVTPHNEPLHIMQSIFSPSARRDTLPEAANLDRRDGELKMDWTKPLVRRPRYVC